MLTQTRTAWVVSFVLVGCSASGGPAHDAGPIPRPEVREFVDEEGTHFFSLTPARLGEIQSIGQAPVALYLGAIYAGRDGPGGYHSLALVFRTEVDGDRPLLHSGQSLLLEVDGTFFASSALPGGAAYRVDTDIGEVRETVMIPMNFEQLREVAMASTVRGRIGPWFSFTLPPANRTGLLQILDRIPENVPLNSRPVAQRIIATRGQ